jgi:TGF-beta propeptide
MNYKSRIVAKQNLAAAVLGLLVLFSSGLSQGQITPSADSYTNTVDPTTNYGAKTLLDIDGASQITYIQFNLASIPATASVSQATLKLYVNGVTTAGSFNVDYINSAWSESAIDASNAPPLGSTIASNVSVTTAEKNQYILVNVTSAVQAWLSGSEANNGIALVANGTFNATFDSKENTTTSHPPELDIAFAGGEGTITGVTTASGSGLSGGGTSGTLNLGLTSACAKNQVLQWNGSAWGCASAGSGKITGVTAGTDLTGGGTSGTVTLNLDTTKVPLLAAANTFTGDNTFSVSTTDAIDAYTSGPGKTAVVALSNATSGGSYGVYATTQDSSGAGVLGINGASSGAAIGIFGLSNYGTGVQGSGPTGVTANGVNFGVYATASAANTIGVYGAGGVNGVVGATTLGTGVEGIVSTGSGVGGWATNGNGVFGTVTSSGYGVYGQAQGIEGYGGGFFNSTGGFAGYFQGNVDVVGSLSKSSGSFKIDHPLDPANKYLYHSFVESPDMKNIYDGVATLDAGGEATVVMPDWFDTLNRDFRYQLTCIGGFAPVYIAEELANNQFKIGGGRAGMRISWQITGIRQDPWANAHRIPVEQEKEDKLKGFYLHPELYGAPADKQIEWARHPEMMKKLQQTTDQTKEKQVRLTQSAALPQGSTK